MRGFRLNLQRAERLIKLVDKCKGHCPCAIVKDESTLCPCDSFINDKECTCGMYEKIPVCTLCGEEIGDFDDGGIYEGEYCETCFQDAQESRLK